MPATLIPAEIEGIARIAAHVDVVTINREADSEPVDVTLAHAIADQFVLYVGDDGTVYRLADEFEAAARASELVRSNLLPVTAEELPPHPRELALARLREARAKATATANGEAVDAYVDLDEALGEFFLAQ